MKKFKIALIYDSGKRYIFPFEIANEVLKLNQKQINKLEERILLELSK